MSNFNIVVEGVYMEHAVSVMTCPEEHEPMHGVTDKQIVDGMLHAVFALVKSESAEKWCDLRDFLTEAVVRKLDIEGMYSSDFYVTVEAV